MRDADSVSTNQGLNYSGEERGKGWVVLRDAVHAGSLLTSHCAVWILMEIIASFGLGMCSSGEPTNACKNKSWEMVFEGHLIFNCVCACVYLKMRVGVRRALNLPYCFAARMYVREHVSCIFERRPGTKLGEEMPHTILISAFQSWGSVLNPGVKNRGHSSRQAKVRWDGISCDARRCWGEREWERNGWICACQVSSILRLWAMARMLWV